jgi:branched-chain amino acid transport system permease protein
LEYLVTIFFPQWMHGLVVGSGLGLICIGLTLVFGVMNIVNFAHGDFVMVAMYATFWISTGFGWDPVATPIITIPLLFLIGVVAYYLLIHRTLRRNYVTQIAVTVGLMVFLRSITQVLFQARPRTITQSIIQGTLNFGPYTITMTRLISALVAIVTIVAIYLFLAKTWTGWAIRAASDDLDSASLVGIDPTKTYALSLGLGSALTALAGALLITFQQVDPTMGMRFGLLSWAILALAGLGSIPGLLIAGTIVGIVESLTAAYWDPRARSLTVYLIFILILWLKPKGLFGRK